MASPDYDVIVAGAGAGGAAAAYFLTSAELRVLVVERGCLPRYKACGGAIPRPTMDRFPFASDSVIRAAPTAIRFAFPGLKPVDLSLPDRPVVMVMRSEFDALLLARSGTEVREAQPVVGATETGSVVKVGIGDRTATDRDHRPLAPGWTKEERRRIADDCDLPLSIVSFPSPNTNAKG